MQKKKVNNLFVTTYDNDQVAYILLPSAEEYY